LNGLPVITNTSSDFS